MRRLVGLLILAALLSVAAAAWAEPGPGRFGKPVAARVDANGNPFTGGLEFDPAEVSVKVRQKVVWTNTDSSVPHNAVEDHGLWEVSGTYGEPISPGGLEPGETKGRTFDAGTFDYFCEIHPEDMRGTVAVPVRLRPVDGGRRVKAIWGAGRLPQGQGFDVQRRKGKGKWKALAKGTRSNSDRFRAGDEGTRWSVRARLRELDEPKNRSGWSPRETLRAR